MIEYSPECVGVDDILVPSGRRQHTPQQIAKLAESIGETGLLEPIVITHDYRLVAGLGRLQATRLLGRKTIDARKVELSNELMQLAELDENLVRTPLSAAAELEAIKHRQQLWQQLHPYAPLPPVDDDAPFVPQPFVPEPSVPTRTFIADTAAATGQGTSTIFKKVRIANRIMPEALAQIAGTPIEDSQQELENLSRIPAEQQLAVVEKVKSGKAEHVSTAYGACPNCGSTNLDAAGDCVACVTATPRPRLHKESASDDTMLSHGFARIRKAIGELVRATTNTRKKASGGDRHRDAIKRHCDEIIKITERWEVECQKQCKAG